MPPDDEEPIGADEKPSDESSVELAVSAESAVAERDLYMELIAAAEKCNRVRFRVKPDHSSTMFGVLLMTALIVAAGAVLINISKSNTGKILVGAIMLIGIAVAVALAVYYALKSRRVFYCYYARDDRGVFCVSVIGDKATVFAYGTAYRIDGETFYTLDEKGYRDFMDGEGCGVYSVLSARRESVEADGNTYIVRGGIGGGHEVTVEDGRIVKIVSEQPYYTDEIDPKTGERKIKTKRFEKTDPVENFAWEIPAFVKQAFADNGVELPDMRGL